MTANLLLLGVDVKPAGGGGPTVLILDQFTDTDATALQSHTIAPTNTPGASWGVENALKWTIQSNRANGANGAGSAFADAGQADVTVTCDVYPDTSSYDGIIARYSNSTNFWLLTVRSDLSEFSIYEFSTGNGVVQRATTTVSITAGTKYTLALVVSGTSLSGTINGGHQITYTSSVNQTNTKHGLRGGTGAPTFDNFQVTQP
jgi:hypothetical protein